MTLLMKGLGSLTFLFAIDQSSASALLLLNYIMVLPRMVAKLSPNVPSPGVDYLFTLSDVQLALT